jgi:dihydropteroate synthase
VPAEEELARLLPVLGPLRAATAAPLAVDTRKGAVARAALAAGADLVNDVEALADPALAETVAAAGCPVVLMHSRGDFATTMQHQARYGDVVAEVRAELAAAMARAESAGVAREQIVLDPGLGFAKRAEHNWALLRDLGPLESLGYPVLVGASRKTFLGRLLADSGGTVRPVDQREHANTALTVLLAQRGVWGLRVHDVRAARDALRVLERLDQGEQG